MKNTYGQSLTLTLFGESHGPEIGAVLDGLAPGIRIDTDFIAHQLDLRRPSGAISTKRREPDPFRIVSGMINGRTTGTPLTILIPNTAQRSGDYASISGLARPGHADYAAQCKYHGFQDARGGGHFSGRLTAPLVAAGAILIDALKEKGIMLGTHVAECACVKDRPFGDYLKDIETLSDKVFPVLDEESGKAMNEKILEAAQDGDSVGGILETVIIGMPAGVGEPWFDTVESQLAHMLFSVPAVKGVEFGIGFAGAALRGSQYNDAFRAENGHIVTATNHNGGVNGGITNGMPITFRCAVKPTPSIYKKQETVDFLSMQNSPITIEGRHDPAIIHRARIVVDSMSALVISDMLCGRYGTDWLKSAEADR